jgi:hypothetical protein
MARKLLNPNSLPPEPSIKEIRRALVDIWYLVSESPQTITDDYTTNGAVAKEILVCTNTRPITIYLNPTPNDGDEVIIKRQNEEIVVDGNGNTIDGETSFPLSSIYDGPHLVYTDNGGEWSIVGFLGFPRDAQGRIRVVDEDSKETLSSLEYGLKLLNERFEEAFETHIGETDVD